ncbi:MAG: hypothetical protein ABSC93_04450 [Bryobacteraceae bacterium]
MKPRSRMAVETALVTVEEFSRLQSPLAGHYELHHGEIVHRLHRNGVMSGCVGSWVVDP